MERLEAGRISNTHGVRGAVRILPWADSPEFLCGFERLYIEGENAPRRVLSASVHKSQVLCQFDGVDTMEKAIALRGKLVYIDRNDVELEEGRHFVCDIIGLKVRDVKLGMIGRVSDVLSLPAHDVYEVSGAKTYLIPVVPQFVKSVNVAGGYIEVEIIEGMDE